MITGITDLTQELSGRTAIVTGGARGIGAAITLELARRGSNVVINYTSDSSKAPADKLVGEISTNVKNGVKAVAVQANIAKLSEHKKIVDAALSVGKQIHILVHNAGISRNFPVGELTEEDFDEHFNINVKAPFFLTQAALPHMPEHGSGRIVLLTSVSARMGVPTQTVYAATKASLESAARVWAHEFGQKKGITVNCVNPGPVDTDMWQSTTEEFKKGILDNGAPLGKPQDIADIVAFLASDRSRWTNGSVINSNNALLCT